MADNLTVSIGADTSKLRADLKLAQVQFQQLNKEMTAAARQAAATGDRTNLDKLSKEADAAAKSYQNLNRQLAEANKTVAQTSVWSGATKAVAGLKEELIGLAKATAAGFGLRELFNLVGKTADEILQLRRMSQATGFDPTAIKAIDETLEDTGAEAGSANKALLKLSEAYGKLRQNARAAGEDIGNNVTTLRGSIDTLSESAQKTQRAAEAATGVNTLRGAQRNVQTIKDAEDAFAALQVQWKKFPQTMEGQTDFLQAVINGFDRLGKQGKTDLLNMAAFELLGARNAKEFGAAIKRLAEEHDGLRKKMQELRDQGRDPNEEAIKRALEYKKALRDVEDAWDSLGNTALRVFGPTIQEAAKGLENDISAINRASQDIAKLWETYVGPTLTKAWEAFVKDLKELWGSINWSAMWDGFVSAATKALNAVLYAAKAVAAQIRDITSPPAATATIPPVADSNLSDLGFAAGGRVRGRGTGTSDSILARLSNGEFVVNAAATSRFLPLLRAINDGMSQPLMPRTSFATGGLVMATDAATGTPVHLHIGGHSFPMRTDSIVAESLIRTAREKQLLSAGRKPSWAGGRRYGG